MLKKSIQALAIAIIFAAMPNISMAVEKTSTIDMQEVLKANPMPDKFEGNAKAPVTVVEYFSLLCSHCAHFHKDTYGKIKENYIKTGKVKFIHRDYFWEPVSNTASLLAWCSGDKYYSAMEFFFENQAKIFANKGKEKETIGVLAKQMGFTDDSYKACLANTAIKTPLMQMRDYAENKLKIAATPTFIIEGEVYSGAMPYEDFALILDRHLAKVTPKK